MNTYRRRPSVERNLYGGRVLVHAVGADAPVELAGSAPIVWDLLVEHTDDQALLDALLELYTDTPEVIAGGRDAAIGLLISNNLVERVS